MANVSINFGLSGARTGQVSPLPETVTADERGNVSLAVLVRCATPLEVTRIEHLNSEMKTEAKGTAGYARIHVPADKLLTGPNAVLVYARDRDGGEYVERYDVNFNAPGHAVPQEPE